MTKTVYSRSQIAHLYHSPLLELIAQASQIHKDEQGFRMMHLNTLISFKTGGCSEDCAYCAQSARYNTHIGSSNYLSEQEIMKQAEEAALSGSKRICISASWKRVPDNEQFEIILEAGRKIRKMGLQVCATLGTVSRTQIQQLKNAGFTAYNHNVDTSENFYPEIITTRTYAERVEMLRTLQDEDMGCCSGGIIGLGESEDDRIDMLHVLYGLEKPLFTFPINTLVAVPGTPMADRPEVPLWDLLRVIATARILMPSTRICLAAGRRTLSEEAQTLCFLAGANSFFIGDKLLTTDNAKPANDKLLLETLGLCSHE